jgi:hypothetical protein
MVMRKAGAVSLSYQDAPSPTWPPARMWLYEHAPAVAAFLSALPQAGYARSAGSPAPWKDVQTFPALRGDCLQKIRGTSAEGKSVR